MSEIQGVAPWVLSSLETKWPARVVRDSILVTGERSGAQIVLIPHRQLGGFCLGVWADLRGIEVLWGRVTDLSTHDQVDLGMRVARVSWGNAWQTELQQQLFAELERSITVTVRPG